MKENTKLTFEVFGNAVFTVKRKLFLDCVFLPSAINAIDSIRNMLLLMNLFFLYLPEPQDPSQVETV